MKKGYRTAAGIITGILVMTGCRVTEFSQPAQGAIPDNRRQACPQGLDFDQKSAALNLFIEELQKNYFDQEGIDITSGKGDSHVFQFISNSEVIGELNFSMDIRDAQAYSSISLQPKYGGGETAEFLVTSVFRTYDPDMSEEEAKSISRKLSSLDAEQEHYQKETVYRYDGEKYIIEPVIAVSYSQLLTLLEKELRESRGWHLAEAEQNGRILFHIMDEQSKEKKFRILIDQTGEGDVRALHLLAEADLTLEETAEFQMAALSVICANDRDLSLDSAYEILREAKKRYQEKQEDILYHKQLYFYQYSGGCPDELSITNLSAGGEKGGTE